MKVWSVFRITLREQLRSPWDLLLVLALAPGMVALYWSFFGGSGSTSYTVLALNQDRGSYAQEAIQAMRAMTYPDGAPLVKVSVVASRAEAETLLRDRKAAALVIFQPGYSEAITAARGGDRSTAASAHITLSGDLANPYYTLAATLANAAVDDYTHAAAGAVKPLVVTEEPLGGTSSLSEFEIYVPGLIVAATTMMMFSVAIAVTRQVEAGTLRRLQMTPMTSLDFLGGVSLLYLLVAVLSVGLTFLTARALGFHGRGSLWLGGLICALASCAVIGVGLLVACFSKTVARAAVIVNFPLIVLLFFSGAVFPMPNPPLFQVAGRGFGLLDLLPHTHAVLALNKVLTLGAGWGEVTFELAAIGVLSLVYFGAGVWLFRRRHLSPQ